MKAIDPTVEKLREKILNAPAVARHAETTPIFVDGSNRYGNSGRATRRRTDKCDDRLATQCPS